MPWLFSTLSSIMNWPVNSLLSVVRMKYAASAMISGFRDVLMDPSPANISIAAVAIAVNDKYSCHGQNSSQEH